jgi:hypothetical protein
MKWLVEKVVTEPNKETLPTYLHQWSMTAANMLADMGCANSGGRRMRLVPLTEIEQHLSDARVMLDMILVAREETHTRLAITVDAFAASNVALTETVREQVEEIQHLRAAVGKRSSISVVGPEETHMGLLPTITRPPSRKITPGKSIEPRSRSTSVSRGSTNTLSVPFRIQLEESKSAPVSAKLHSRRRLDVTSPQQVVHGLALTVSPAPMLNETKSTPSSTKLKNRHIDPAASPLQSAWYTPPLPPRDTPPLPPRVSIGKRTSTSHGRLRVSSSPDPTSPTTPGEGIAPWSSAHHHSAFGDNFQFL